VETVDDEPAVRAFLSSYFRWEAGAVAAMTEGFVSARPVSGAHNGVELMGLQPEGVFPMPLPSPTCGLVDGVLVFSPFRSAAEETIDSIRSRPSPIQGQRENIPAPDSVPATGAVERFHISLPGWGAQLEKLAALVPDRNSAPLKPPVASFLSAISRILGALGPVDGATTMREDGTFSCRIEIKPVRSDKQR
jgi:hypothetical protein